MSGASAFVHPLSSLRSKLEELVERGDAEQLERLLEGEDMPLLGGHEEPAELLHRALLRQPYQPDLVLSLAPVLGSVLKRQAAALAKEALPPAPALGRAVRNALLLAELLPPAAPIFEGVAAIYEPLAGYAIDSEQPEDRYTLGLRLRAALCCQQDDNRFADFWSTLLKSASSTDLMDGLRGLLWLPVVSEPSGMGLLAKGLELFGCNALQHSDHPLLLGWAVATLADALPHSPGFWQEHLAPLAAGWPPELRTAFQKRWPTVDLTEAKQAEVVPKKLVAFWRLLNPEEQEKILAVRRGPRTRAAEALRRIDKVLAEVEGQLAKGRSAQAAQFLQELLDWQVQDNEPKYTSKTCARAATLYQRFGLLEPAQELLEKAIDLAPGDVVPRNGLAELLKSRGELSEAERLYRETVTRFPSDVVARTGLAELLKSRGELSESERLYRETVTRFPENVVARNGLAELLKRRGELAESERLYRETVTRFPSDVVARTGLAELLKSRVELSESERLYRETVTRFPENVVARNGLAELLKSRGELSESECLYRETVTRFPENVVARNGLANVLRALRRFDEALALLPQPANLKTRQDFIDLHLRGMIFLSQGRLDEAKRVLERGLRDCTFKEHRAYYRSALAVLALRQARWAEVDQWVAADTSPVGKVLQFHARAGSGQTAAAGQLARELQTAKILPFPVRRAFEEIRDGYGILIPGGFKQPTPAVAGVIFEYEIEMVGAAANDQPLWSQQSYA